MIKSLKIILFQYFKNYVLHSIELTCPQQQHFNNYAAADEKNNNVSLMHTSTPG